MKLCFLEFTKTHKVDLDIMSPGLLTQNLKKKKKSRCCFAKIITTR